MRVCITRNDNFEKSFVRSINFEEISNSEFDVFGNMYEVPFIGLNFYFQADFRIRSELDPRNYDAIIHLEQGKFENERPHDRLYIVNGVEIMGSEQWQGSDDLSFAIPDHIDGFLNNFILQDANEKNMAFHYRYDTRSFAKFISDDKTGIMIQKRTTVTPDLSLLIDELNLQPVTENWGSWNYETYCTEFGRCKYLINLDENRSAGQIIAESVMLDVICFARPEKLFSKLVLHPFLHVEDLYSAIAKIKQLESDSGLLKEILSYNQSCRHLLDYSHQSESVNKLFPVIA